jgi:hypothetical protein
VFWLSSSCNMVRQRITFLHKAGKALPPSALRVTDDSIHGSELEAAREERLTIALDELPSELRDVLQDSHELHVRWVSPYAYESLSPVLSRLSPGLHVLYTPQHRGDASLSRSGLPSPALWLFCPFTDQLGRSNLCTVLRRSFGGGIDCDSPEVRFLSRPNGLPIKAVRSPESCS